MANALYNPARDGFLTGVFNWTSSDIRVLLIDTAQYTFNVAHYSLADVPAAARLATAAALTGKTAGSGGVADASDPTFPAVASGKIVGAYILYLHTGVESTSRLIGYFDTGTNLPVATNGGDISISFNTSGIFKL